MPKLGLVVDVTDLPLAELCAARLDGELMAIDDCFAPVDLPPTALQRAAALGRTVSNRLIAERMSAAWIYGALSRAPIRHELCINTTSRVNIASSSRFLIREVVIGTSEIRELGRLSVTTPLRTAVDIARSLDDFTHAELEVLRGLLRFGRISQEQCVQSLNATGHLPHKKRALQRIRDAFSRL